MHHTNQTDGGTEAQRGFLFQTYSILLHLLIRRIESRDLEIANLSVDVEPLDGEDAKFISVSFESQSPDHVVEIIQCKKRESSKSHNIRVGMRPGDEYLAGEVNHSDFKQWIEKKRHGQSVADILAANKNTFYTTIIFGEPTGRVRDYIPEPFAEVSGLKWYSPMSSRVFPINYTHPSVDVFIMAMN